MTERYDELKARLDRCRIWMLGGRSDELQRFMEALYAAATAGFSVSDYDGVEHVLRALEGCCAGLRFFGGGLPEDDELYVVRERVYRRGEPFPDGLGGDLVEAV